MECRDGRIINLSNSSGRGNSLIVSPDGKLIAYDRAELSKPAQVWLMRIDGSEQRKITWATTGANVAEWVSNTQLQYTRKTINSCKLYQNNIDGSFELSRGDCN